MVILPHVWTCDDETFHIVYSHSVIVNLAKQGYCNHFVCLSVYLSVCLSVCLFVCLFSVCPESIYIHTTQHMEYYTEHYDVIS